MREKPEFNLVFLEIDAPPLYVARRNDTSKSVRSHDHPHGTGLPEVESFENTSRGVTSTVGFQMVKVSLVYVAVNRCMCTTGPDLGSPDLGTRYLSRNASLTRLAKCASAIFRQIRSQKHVLRGPCLTRHQQHNCPATPFANSEPTKKTEKQSGHTRSAP